MVEKIKGYQFSNRFKKEYQLLPKDIQNAFDKKPSLLLKNIRHPSLRVKKMEETKSIWEGSVTSTYRFTFEYSEDVLLFRRIGTHDILRKEN